MSMWKNPDVHAHTAEMRSIMSSEFPKLPKLAELYMKDFDTVCTEIERHYAGNGSIAQCINKLRVRKDVRDHDLQGISLAGLLCIVWIDCVKPSGELYDHFACILQDMGTTCVQGDSHRLFSLYVASVRSISE